MKIKKIIFLLSIIVTSVASFSCIKTNQVKPNNQYIINFNSPNPYQNGNFKIHENRKYQNAIEKALFAPLIKYSSSGNLIVDKINNKITQPSTNYLSFYLAKSIKLYFNENKTLTYINDKYLPIDDFSEQKFIVFGTSKDITSINHPNFWININNANKIEFSLKDLNFVTKDGKKTNYKLHAKNILNNFTQKDFNLFNTKYGINLKVDNDKLIIENKSNKAKFFIENELMQNLIFNPKVLNSTDPNFNELYLSPFLPTKNTINQIQLIKNNFIETSNDNKFANKINIIDISFAPTPLDIETFRVQQFRSFRQNLISEVNFNVFNSYQKNDILEKSSQYGLRDLVQNNFLKIRQNWIYKTKINENKPKYFNDVFENLYFKDKNLSYQFKYWISRLYSKFALFNNFGYDYYWNSLALPETKLNNNLNEESTFENLNDAYIWTTIQYIDNFSKINFVDEKNYYFENKNILNFEKQFQNIHFDKIKQYLKQLIDQFYLKNSVFKNKKIKFQYPIDKNINQTEFKIIFNYVKLLNSIDERLEVEVLKLSENEINNGNFFIEKFNYQYLNNSLEEFIKLITENEQFSVYLNKKNLNLNYEILSNFNLINEKNLHQFINNQNKFNQIKLIIELNNLIPLPISFIAFDPTKSINKILVQPYYQYPLTKDSIVNFEDIITK
ncbi:OppA family ABC transporter substrate-binding lipoprotein [Mycoplasmopsis cricetuli]|uniref:OppA family ABC transporter substrate-binding lipoprotein n=1 Tax=Mycoplasmopsis cricetuli TaxID=171283 RepID=UPI000472FB5A|nr:hypothetical protein [Mycoplasmopsis cricetuli]